LQLPIAHTPLEEHVDAALGKEHGVQLVAAHPYPGSVLLTQALPQSF
jgi:hypothetical protein